jgi:Pre-mRNA splicing Prp18-interacting factor
MELCSPQSKLLTAHFSGCMTIFKTHFHVINSQFNQTYGVFKQFQTGARFTGQAIAADEYAQPNLLVDYDGKRDRWNGYDPSEHGAIIEEFQKVEDAKRLLKEEKLKATPADGEEGEGEVSFPIVDSKEPLTVTF